ncbi:MAG: MATE family efflux transporter, partial [Eggerthellaceae bacterium]|nr:MATE family efflux transporter [Eggerthellaceae bacterium]
MEEERAEQQIEQEIEHRPEQDGDELRPDQGNGEGKLEGGRKALTTDRLGQKSILSLLIEFSIPAIIMMTFNALYNIVDSIFLGQAVGEMGIAVTTLAFPIMILLMGLSALAGQGGNALAAIQLGEDKIDKVERTVGNTVLLLIIIAAIIALAGIVLIEPILALVGTTPELHDLAKTFVQILMVGFVFQCIGMGANNFLRTEGKPMLALGTSVLGTVVCIVMNFVLVMWMGFGVAGSAFATIIGQGVGGVPVIWYLVKGKDAPFHLRLSRMKPDIRLWGTILSLGLASFIMQVANAVINSILNQTLAYYGAMDPIGSAGALAAIGVASRVNGFAFMPAIGVLMGAQTLIGYNYGARKWGRVLKSYWLGVLFATIIITSFFILIHVIPEPIVKLFGVEGDLEQFCIYALMVMTAMFPLVGFQMMSSNYFQSTGQPLKASLLSLTRQVLFLIPLLLLLPRFLPSILDVTSLQAICFTYPTADVLSIITTTAFIVP